MLDIKPERRDKSPVVAKKERSEQRERERSADKPDEGRRVVRRIGAIGSAALEKHAIENEKEKFLRGTAETE